MKITKVIQVSNCRMCPFVNYFYDAGRYDGCNFPGNKVDEELEMPKDKVHKNCPLKLNDIKIGL